MAVMEVANSIDTQIAAILGQTKVGECPLGDPTCPGKYEPQIGRWPCLPPYATNIEAAFLAAEQYGLFSDETTHGYDCWLGKEFGLWLWHNLITIHQVILPNLSIVQPWPSVWVF